ncbi:MAG: hypothetical protein IKY66_05460 [Bacteroidales bacterium]|nr:hypothetical protein [Bacteroidales bacterium]
MSTYAFDDNLNKIEVKDKATQEAKDSTQDSRISALESGKAGTSLATTSANGLMSSTDKSKLDGVESGANKTVVDSALSSSSTNPLQNKVVNNAIYNLGVQLRAEIPKVPNITISEFLPTGGNDGDIWIVI